MAMRPPNSPQESPTIFVRLVAYFWRLRHQPLKVALWVLWALGVWRAVQVFLPAALPSYDRNPRTVEVVLGAALVAGIVFLLTLMQRGPLAWTWRDLVPSLRRSRALSAAPPPPDWDEWVIGTAHRRVWQPNPGKYEVIPAVEPYGLIEDELRTSTIIVAPPGAGKTSSFGRPALRYFRRVEASVIYVDPKGDDYDPADFDFNLDISNAERSDRLYLYPGDLAEAVDQFAEAMIPSGDPATQYFADNAKNTMRTLVLSHFAATKQRPTLRQLLDYLASKEQRRGLLEQLEKLAPGGALLKDMARVDSLAGMKSDPLGNLYNALAPMATESMSRLLVADPGDAIDIGAMMQRPGVRIRLAVPVGRYPDLAKFVVRLVAAQFRNAVVSPGANKDHLKVLLIDEAGRFLTHTIADGISLTRSNKGAYVLMVQNLAQITDLNIRRTILTNAGCKVVAAGVDDEEADVFSRLFGEEELSYLSVSVTTGEGASQGTSRGTTSGFAGTGSNTSYSSGSSENTNSGSNWSRSQGATASTRLRRRWLLSEIRDIPQYHCIIEARDERGRIRPATLVHLDRAFAEQVAAAQDQQLAEIGRVEVSEIPAQPQIPRALPDGGEELGRRESTWQVWPGRVLTLERASELADMGRALQTVEAEVAALAGEQVPVNTLVAERLQRRRVLAQERAAAGRAELAAIGVEPARAFYLADLLERWELAVRGADAQPDNRPLRARQVWLEAKLGSVLDPLNTEKREQVMQAAISAYMVALQAPGDGALVELRQDMQRFAAPLEQAADPGANAMYALGYESRARKNVVQQPGGSAETQPLGVDTEETRPLSVNQVPPAANGDGERPPGLW